MALRSVRLLLLTKVGQFEFSSVVDEKVLRLQVSVEDLPPVAVGQTSQDLEEENLEGRRRFRSADGKKISEKTLILNVGLRFSDTCRPAPASKPQTLDETFCYTYFYSSTNAELNLKDQTEYTKHLHVPVKDYRAAFPHILAKHQAQRENTLLL